MPDICEWKKIQQLCYDVWGWKRSCGPKHLLYEDEAPNPKWHCCPYCGKPIRETRWKPKEGS